MKRQAELPFNPKIAEHLMTEYDVSTCQYQDNVYFQHGLLARVIDDGVSTTTVSYAHLNHLGSPVAFTDDIVAPATCVIWPGQTAGLPYEIHSYEPFGADFNDLGAPTLNNDLRYTGKLFESATGKQYFNARYYNGVTSTAFPEQPPLFMSPDILGGNTGSGQSWNRYAYCQGNPVGYVDLDGKNFIYLLDRNAVIDQGHSAVITGPVNGMWRYDSFGKRTKDHRQGQYYFSSEQEALDFAKKHDYTDYAKWLTNPDEDKAAQKEADNWHAGNGEFYEMFREYSTNNYNCQYLVDEMAKKEQLSGKRYLANEGVRHPNLTFKRNYKAADKYERIN